jgi:hydroxyacylglutathione hydrolase
MENMLAQNKFFTAYRIADGVTRIVGMAMECCYLLEGTKRALLIDGLTGIGSLKAFVREMTNLPVTVALTHAHFDHSGVAWESEAVYLHPADNALLYADETTHKKQCLDFVQMYRKLGIPARTTPTMADVLGVHPLRTLPVCDGDVFDLGELTVKAIAVPGHTRGSMVYVDCTHRMAFAGDACNANTLLNLNGSASVAQYQAGLAHWRTCIDTFDVLWNGHDHTAIPKTIIDDGITLCQKILAHTDDAIEIEDAFGGTSRLAAKRLKNFAVQGGGLCNIVYKPETVERSESPAL